MISLSSGFSWVGLQVSIFRKLSILLIAFGWLTLLRGDAAVILNEEAEMMQEVLLEELSSEGINAGLDLVTEGFNAESEDLSSIKGSNPVVDTLVGSLKQSIVAEDYDGAVYILRNLLAELPGNIKVMVLLAVSHAQLDECEEAIYYANMALEEYVNTAKAYSVLGACYNKLGRLEKAAEAYQRLVQLEPDSPEAFFALGQAFLRLDNLAAAVKSFRLGAELRPQDPVGFYRVGVMNFNVGNSTNAIAYHRKALSLDPNFSLAWEGIGAAQQVLQKNDEALIAYENALNLNNRSFRAASNLGVLKYSSGDRAGGLSWTLKALEIHISYVEAWRNYLAMLEQEVRTQDPDLEVKYNEKDDDGSWHYKRGLKALKENEYPEAFLLILRALQINFPHPEYFNDAGTVLGLMNNPNFAVPFFRAAVALYPEYDSARRNLALSREMGQTEVERQLGQVLSEISDRPNDALLLLRAGNLFMQSGDAAKAEELFLRAASSDPKLVNAQVRLAQHFFELGNHKDAVKHMGKALRLDSANPYWKYRMANLLLSQNEPGYSDVELATRLAREACEITKFLRPEPLVVLAKAQAVAEDYAEAVSLSRKALALSQEKQNAALTEQIKRDLRVYQAQIR